MKTNIAILVLTLVLLCEAGVCQPKLPQKWNVGFSLVDQIGANGYGAQLLPSVYLRKGRRSYCIAPTLQTEKWTLSGVQFNYEYAITGLDVPHHEDDELELYAFMHVAYHHDALMGKTTLQQEEMADHYYKRSQDCEMHFTSAEIYGGCGLKIPFLKRFKWKNAIGLGYFHSFHFPCHLYYEGSNLGVVIKTGISMELSKKKRHKR